MKDRKAAGRPSRQDSTASMDKTELAPAKPNTGLNREIQKKIGDQLRAMYDDVVAQGVPSNFEKFLNQLNDKGGGGDRS